MGKKKQASTPYPKINTNKHNPSLDMSDSPVPLQIDSSKEILEELMATPAPLSAATVTEEMATPSPVPVESGQTSGNEEATPLKLLQIQGRNQWMMLQ